jgi:hypothetical protein
MVRRSCINSTDDLCIELSSGDYPFHDRQCVCHVFGIGRDIPDQGGINLRPAQGIDPAKKQNPVTALPPAQPQRKLFSRAHDCNDNDEPL